MNFGERFREIRETAGVSQRELHRRTSLSSSYIHYIEKGQVVPGDDNLVKLARGLGVSQKRLFEERERAEFEKRGVNPEVSIQLKKLGDLTEEEEGAILEEVARIDTARHRKRGKRAGAK